MLFRRSIVFLHCCRDLYIFCRVNLSLGHYESQIGQQRISAVKKLSDTRWSARQDAVKALAKGPSAIKEVLDHLASDEEQTLVTRNEAVSISEKIYSLEFAFVVLFWHDLLDRIHKTNLSLQKIDTQPFMCGRTLQQFTVFYQRAEE